MLLPTPSSLEKEPDEEERGGMSERRRRTMSSNVFNSEDINAALHQVNAVKRQQLGLHISQLHNQLKEQLLHGSSHQQNQLLQQHQQQQQQLQQQCGIEMQLKALNWRPPHNSPRSPLSFQAGDHRYGGVGHSSMGGQTGLRPSVLTSPPLGDSDVMEDDQDCSREQMDDCSNSGSEKSSSSNNGDNPTSFNGLGGGSGSVSGGAGGSSYDSKNKRKKKTRTVFSRSQVFQLESTFDMKRYLSSSERAGLASALHLTETQVSMQLESDS